MTGRIAEQSRGGTTSSIEQPMNFENVSRAILTVGPASWELVEIVNEGARTVSGILRCTSSKIRSPAFSVELDPLSGRIKTAELIRFGDRVQLDPREVDLSPAEAVSLASIVQCKLLEFERQADVQFSESLGSFRKTERP